MLYLQVLFFYDKIEVDACARIEYNNTKGHNQMRIPATMAQQIHRILVVTLFLACLATAIRFAWWIWRVI